LVAYPSGSTVVINNPKGHNQAHLVSTSKNNITCLAFSPCGRFIVTGEFGCDPMVRVWELQRDGQNFGQQIAELKEHKIGISCVVSILTNLFSFITHFSDFLKGQQPSYFCWQSA
jgi:WD40 repeat protein